ncbi:MAG: tetratricopeptide repeat protein [Pirellulaceae bacterium]|nr:tetratricopeptide repeat protein [Pirellulaceae bacterium]
MIRAGLFAWNAVCFFALTLISAPRAPAANEGQADLDKATELQVTAQSMSDLGKVAELCESALKKGLEEDNQAFAKQLLSSTLYQFAEQLSGPIFDQTPPHPRWQLMRDVAAKHLERAVEVSPTLGDAHLLIARLQALPGGDAARGAKAAGAAVNLFEEDKKKKAAALVLRGGFRQEPEAQLQDYGQAIDLDPGNADAWQARALVHLDQGDADKAIEDFNSLLKQNENNVNAHLALAEALTNLEKLDEALPHIEKAIQLKPDSPLGYTLRARWKVLKEDMDGALNDLDQAIKIEPRDVMALVIRARLHLSQDNLAAAKDDVERMLLISPGLVQGILMRSMIYAEEGRVGDAIADIESLLKQDPKNVSWRLQLAGYYIKDRRPSKALDIFTKILAEDDEDFFARQARADTLLSIGKHAEAIADFEVLLKQKPEDDSILNNFAWVLATSPEDKLRDGTRAIQLATKACEVTEYKKPHVLSTLAAAYAETGDFDSAVKWSGKAVEMGVKEKEVDDQLKKELESYQQKKPWRERQTIEEKADPVQSRRSDFEA